MALKPATTTESSNALFEEQDMPEVQAASAVETPVAQAAQVFPVASAVPVAVSATQVAKPIAKFVPALTEFQNAIPLETIEGMGVGGLPKIVADLGGFMMDGDKPLGNQIKLQLLSWNVKHVIITGSQDKEAGEFFKVSYDGENLVGGGSVDEYINWLKNVKGYEKAGKKQYIDLWGYLTAANGKDLAEDDCKTVNVQVAPYSCSKFHAFQLDLGIRQARGQQVSDVIVLNAERGKMGSNNFGYMTFAVK